MATQIGKREQAIIDAQKARVAAGKKATALAVKNDAEWARKGGTWN